MKLGSLFSGAAGLDLAVEAVFGAHTVWHVELDPAASKVLAHRYPGVVNHRDITAVDWATVEPVDILCGGWPCQPWSSAGKRLGESDERALWPEVARAVRILRPRIVALENVPGIIVLGELARAVGDLAACGYDTQWCCLRASDIGAPHNRQRVFLIATDSANPPSQGRQGDISQTEPGLPRRHRDGPLLTTPQSRDYKGSNTHDVDSPWQSLARDLTEQPATYLGYFTDEVVMLPTPSASDGIGGGAANPDHRLAQGHHVQLIDLGTSQTAWGKYDPAIRRWEQLTRPAPPPTEPNRNGNPRLAAAFSEWMIGWPAGWVTNVPGISRNDALRIIGNGVVPQCAAAALRWLVRHPQQHQEAQRGA
jgi:DNA (cytosine-5)-methyltransferase 1